ncbi:DinB family protein [Bacillus sp. V3B]|uniref:DinB family protein n=1 Tax=Bacillus sp. V3B TaxID=2804915 RepID=UPI002108D22B|nr:DinB family protein [Bacillus sp. V3B]MCQ6275015.1 DinB family protein [Bacillus sp. V3B]
MSELVKRQFELGRRNLLNDIEGTATELFDVQPEGLSNTIHWQLGHILTGAEGFLFGAEGQLSAEYNELFGYGSKPSAWQDEVPSVETLIQQLKSQLERIKEIPNERFQDQLSEPVLGNSTYGELVSFTAFHELTHIGQVHTMKRLAETSLNK